jgi:hypothetical protein
VVIVEVMDDDVDRACWSGCRRTLESRFRQDGIVVRATAIERLSGEDRTRPEAEARVTPLPRSLRERGRG